MTRRTSAAAETPKRGRPPKSPEGPATAGVLVRMPPTAHARYTAAAERAGVTLTEEAIRAWERLDKRRAR